MKKPVVLSHKPKKIAFQWLREYVVMRVVRWLPAVPFTMLMHWRYHRQLTVFRRPKSYSELVNNKKLYKHDPLLTRTADKYLVREYVAEKIGDRYLIPMQQVTERPQDLEFARLDGHYVIKGTHGCEMTMIVNGADSFDHDEVIDTTQKWLDKDWYHVWKEWAYRDITPRLIVEQFIGEGDEPPVDYKFHTFNGKVAMIQVDTDRFKEHRSTLLSHDWKLLNVGITFGSEVTVPPKPENIDEMIEVAEKLAQDFDHVRVDLYNVDGRIYFGELTHYPGAASVVFNPQSFDDALGELWREGTPIPDHYIDE